ncbi:hypothetical protein NPIL_266051 [Nephila pilipes]|uniref:Uncharacterized protein n=1 Tax=Nephila pilipes TaxID=299642 RepID=A0A8X6Q1V6_NEPPI|nr:hypothetical protein NPIL_598641 [Nephila pilipes]GFT91912.1 hypothetical protein NPIL_522701 [Nephila pilipes]GFU11974.1 hypothetical protein NPIL_266051 [Nephila pilipes]
MHYSSRTLSSCLGSKVQNVRRQFNVIVKLPDHEKPEDTDKNFVMFQFFVVLFLHIFTMSSGRQAESRRDESVMSDRRSGPTSTICRWKQASKQLPDGCGERKTSPRSH